VVTKQLTSGERRVVELVARGLTNQEVAAALDLRTKTVEWTLTNVYRKLRLRSRTELAIHVARQAEL
jgi:DNA-binding NarL/FixJ family response regulator